jgi:hypothetical protein
MVKFKILSLLAALSLLVSCKKDQKIEPKEEPIPVDHKTEVELNFSAKINGAILQLSPVKTFTNNTPGDTFSVERLRYYISNIKLKTNDGYVFAEPESYHLVDHSVNSSLSFKLKNMHEGSYNTIEFLIGVDSLKNVSGAQSGSLDPIHNMFWDWNNGYIIVMVEGKFVSLINTIGSDYTMHIGGFAGSYNCIRKVTLLFPSELFVKKGKKGNILVEADLDKLFSGATNIDLDSYNGVNLGKKAYDVAENYKSMFSVTQIIN